ncbi:TnsA endonuclease N-terminal domain-containing protein [Streptomyces sp. NPDC053726]|uniref:TnsA endonuclease N-terminal domain-containing protein n=1 Tax=Streptomyces sp. NPDC053726 TaxID=3365713 RepID=UPI0037CCE018
MSYQFAGQQRTYYPDVPAATEDDRCIIIEVKPVYEMAMAVNVAKYQAVEEFCRSRGWGLVATDGNRTRGLLEHRAVDPQLDHALAAALDAQGELAWPQVRAATGSLPTCRYWPRGGGGRAGVRGTEPFHAPPRPYPRLSQNVLRPGCPATRGRRVRWYGRVPPAW